MAFDIVAWALGWALGKVGDSVITALTPSEISSRLSSTIESWARALPPECYVMPGAIFAVNEPEPGPARLVLYQHLIDAELPSEEEWHRALIERWQAIRAQQDELQPFFLLSESQASVHLQELARRLTTVCSSDERMFRSATIGLDRRIRDLQDENPIILINEISEPPRWSTSYEVGFHLHNSTGAALLVSNLGSLIEDLVKIERFAPKTPGAPVREYNFEGSLTTDLGPVAFAALGPSRFSLAPDETEFFRANINAEPGWDYLIRITANTMRLHDGKEAEVQTHSFWLSFEGLR